MPPLASISVIDYYSSENRNLGLSSVPRQAPGAGGGATLGGYHAQALPSFTASRARRHSSILTMNCQKPFLDTSHRRNRDGYSNSRSGYKRMRMNHRAGQTGTRRTGESCSGASLIRHQYSYWLALPDAIPMHTRKASNNRLYRSLCIMGEMIPQMVLCTAPSRSISKTIITIDFSAALIHDGRSLKRGG